LPQRFVAGPHEGVDGDKRLDAAAVAVGDGFAEFLAAEIEAGEIARVRLVAEAAIDGAGSRLDGVAEGRGGPGRADQFHAAPAFAPTRARKAASAAVTGRPRGPRGTTSVVKSMPASSSALR